MAAALGHRLPEIQRRLTATGAGQCHLLDGQALCEVIRVAYDPACARYMTPDRPTVMVWSGVGPVRAINHWDHYQHDSAVSASWSMSNVLGRVNADGTRPAAAAAPGDHPQTGQPDLHPAPAGRVAADRVEGPQGRRVPGDGGQETVRRGPQGPQAAEVTATEEAHGNALVDFAVIVTATVASAASLPDVDAVIDSVGPASRLLLRRENGGHAAAFAQSLPGIGLVTAAHSVIPQGVAGVVVSGHLFPSRGDAGPGGGADTYVRAPAIRRASTAQVKGFYPWVAGAGCKLGTGAPLGPILRRTPGPAAILCADPITWFERSGLISNPSAVVLGGAGYGKSTLIRRILLVLAFWGVLPWVLGDVKREYVDLIAALGGQVISLGRGRGYLNVLDLGEAPEAAHRLTLAGHTAAAESLTANAHARRQLGLESLITVQRGREPLELECLVLGAGLEYLDRSHPVTITEYGKRVDSSRAPLVGHLLDLIADPPEAVKDAALWRGDIERYWAATDPLRTSLAALVAPSGLGAVFSRPTTVQVDRNSPLVFDVSGIDKGERKLRAAALLTCWAAGFAAIGVSHALGDAGLEVARRKILATDELWSTLQEGTGLVDRYNGLSRLNRDEGVGTITAFHSSADLTAMESEADRAKAGGLIERAGMLFCAGMPRAEVERLRAVTHFTAREQAEVVSWSTPPTLQTVLGQRRRPPGQGNFLLKAGDGADAPGVAFHLRLTAAELAGINNTDQRWDVA